MMINARYYLMPSGSFCVAIFRSCAFKLRLGVAFAPPRAKRYKSKPNETAKQFTKQNELFVIIKMIFNPAVISFTNHFAE
jgi:hypothetical protein